MEIVFAIGLLITAVITTLALGRLTPPRRIRERTAQTKRAKRKEAPSRVDIMAQPVQGSRRFPIVDEAMAALEEAKVGRVGDTREIYNSRVAATEQRLAAAKALESTPAIIEQESAASARNQWLDAGIRQIRILLRPISWLAGFLAIILMLIAFLVFMFTLAFLALWAQGPMEDLPTWLVWPVIVAACALATLWPVACVVRIVTGKWPEWLRR